MSIIKEVTLNIIKIEFMITIRQTVKLDIKHLERKGVLTALINLLGTMHGISSQTRNELILFCVTLTGVSKLLGSRR